MSVVKINAITVPRERFEDIAQRFAARAGKVSSAEGFEAFELLRPNDDREVCLVITRWRSEEDFKAWLSGPDFAAGHAQHRTGGPVGRRASCGRLTCSSSRGRRASPRPKRAEPAGSGSASARARRALGVALLAATVAAVAPPARRPGRAPAPRPGRAAVRPQRSRPAFRVFDQSVSPRRAYFAGRPLAIAFTLAAVGTA